MLNTRIGSAVTFSWDLSWRTCSWVAAVDPSRVRSSTAALLARCPLLDWLWNTILQFLGWSEIFKDGNNCKSNDDRVASIFVQMCFGVIYFTLIRAECEASQAKQSERSQHHFLFSHVWAPQTWAPLLLEIINPIKPLKPEIPVSVSLCVCSVCVLTC